MVLTPILKKEEIIYNHMTEVVAIESLKGLLVKNDDADTM